MSSNVNDTEDDDRDELQERDEDEGDADNEPVAKRAKKAAKPKFANWCWTAFDPNLSEVWLSIVAPTYWCYGVEICPDSKRVHWQGYLEIKNATTLHALKGKSPPGIHWEPRKGTQDEAVEYCRKDGDFKEWGEKKAGTGQRRDLEAVRKACVSGQAFEKIFDDHFSVVLQYGRGVREYQQLKQVHRNWQTDVICLWGASGVGKSKRANEVGATFVEYDKSGFIHGYSNEEVVCFDDFDPSTMTREVFLRLTDRYHIKVNVKGGSLTWNPRTIYFTSNTNPRDWYNGDEAVRRRMTTVTQIIDPILEMARAAAQGAAAAAQVEYHDDLPWPHGIQVPVLERS